MSLTTVAPLVGAWIEISIPTRICQSGSRSLLSWERGLKYQWYFGVLLRQLSLLSWERGLKSCKAVEYVDAVVKVAPLVGAWIEIPT